MGQLTKNEIFALAVQRYSDTVFRAAMHNCSCTADAEDVVQDVFEKLLCYNGRFASEEHLKAWLLRVTINRCHDLTRAARQKDTELDENLPAPEQMEAAVRSMTTLNKTAAEIARRYEVHAATDVTGFSFLGHLHEMMGEKLSCVIDAHAVPVLPGAWEAADACLYTAAGQRNRNHTGPFVRFEKVPFPMEEILFDPQTSGGLLFAVAPQDAAALEAELQAAGLPAKIVGTIGEKQTPEITVTYE